MMNIWIIKKYDVALKRLFKNFEKDAKQILEKNIIQHEIKQHAYDLPSIALRLRMSAQDTILLIGEDVIKEYVKIGYKQGVQRAKANLNRVGMKDSGLMLPADWRAIDALQVRNLTALRGISDDVNKEIIQSITEGMKNGEDYRRIAERLVERTDSIGINRAELMARTETAFTHNQAAEMRYAQNGIEQVEWFTTLQEKDWGCICPDLDGEIFNLADSWERPPIHPRCMCTIAPVI